MAEENNSKPQSTGSGEGDQSSVSQLADGDFQPHHTGIGTRLRNYFLTGLIIAGPVGITLYIAWWFINLIDGWVKPLLPDRYLPETYLPFTVPGVGLILAVTALILIGALTANLFGRSLVNYGEGIVNRMPIVRSLYRALKQIFETVLSQSNASFQQVGLIQYPREGLYAIVFISTETKGEILHRTDGEDEGLLSVFLPTTPNPTSGFLLFVPVPDVLILDMSVEEAAKLVISAGLVVPHYQEKLKKLAEDAKAPEKIPQKAPV
jgi:uncharacterized membrane protein